MAEKAFDRVAETEHNPHNKYLCWADDAIAQFGVGKNMVASIRHWTTSCDIIEEPDKEDSVKTTTLGQKLFGNNGIKGIDPYMEHPATLWLIHWKLAAQPKKNNLVLGFRAIIRQSPSPVICSCKKIGRLAQDRAWPRVSNTTIKNDVACFIRTYAARQPTGKNRA